jgi:hypothetical protein
LAVLAPDERFNAVILDGAKDQVFRIIGGWLISAAARIELSGG